MHPDYAWYIGHYHSSEETHIVSATYNPIDTAPILHTVIGAELTHSSYQTYEMVDGLGMS